MTRLFEKGPCMYAPLPIVLQDPSLWFNLRKNLTVNQWNWIYLHIIGGMSVEAIAIQENTTAEMVKAWGRQVYRLLASEEFRKKL
ncbi:hypothetical protein GCM10007063_00720 [Lentibacillus kapialis]|uniref:Uncharacterized protein n=1 Tax=Lentibacillus kapialis TaxID=340214 RepID=A0A917PK82_9BACI|nr:hypothetical protein [Lentibacillus kapialis]GGJ82145.1 hypothetical protein GCM10007063_00720 [Lentibacillus kapialis]